MTREEFMKLASDKWLSLGKKYDSCVAVDASQEGILWAFDLLSKQHAEEANELLEVLEQYRYTKAMTQNSVHEPTIAAEALSNYRARHQTSGDGKGE